VSQCRVERYAFSMPDPAPLHPPLVTPVRAAAPHVHVMATPVNGLVAFVHRDLSTEQLARVHAQLSPAELKWFDGKLLAAEKVPLDSVNRYTTLAAAEKAEPAFDFGRRAGRFGAQLGLKTVYKFIMTLLSTESVLRTAPFMWKKVYDSGQMKVESREGTATIRVTEFPAHPCGCGRITGWFEVIGEHSAKDLTARHASCAAQGAPECVWEFQWSR
jgi:hypothetical protein